MAKALAKAKGLDTTKTDAFQTALAELAETDEPYEKDREKLISEVERFTKRFADAVPAENAGQHKAREAFDPIAEQARGLVKQVDLLYKLAARTADTAVELAAGSESLAEAYDRRAASKLVKALEDGRKAAVEQLKKAAYFHRQIAWLQERFPEAKLRDVPGLVKLVDRKDIEAADWSLTPGRYVGVAPPEPDEDFDFEEAIHDIHTEIADLNREGAGLAATIQKKFEELGV